MPALVGYNSVAANVFLMRNTGLCCMIISPDALALGQYYSWVAVTGKSLHGGSLLYYASCQVSSNVPPTPALFNW